MLCDAFQCLRTCGVVYDVCKLIDIQTFRDWLLVYLMRHTKDLCAQCEQSKKFSEGEVVTREDYVNIIEKVRKRGISLGMRKTMGQKCKVIVTIY